MYWFIVFSKNALKKISHQSKVNQSGSYLFSGSAVELFQIIMKGNGYLPKDCHIPTSYLENT